MGCAQFRPRYATCPSAPANAKSTRRQPRSVVQVLGSGRSTRDRRPPPCAKCKALLQRAQILRPRARLRRLVSISAATAPVFESFPPAKCDGRLDGRTARKGGRREGGRKGTHRNRCTSSLQNHSIEHALAMRHRSEGPSNSDPAGLSLGEHWLTRPRACASSLIIASFARPCFLQMKD